MTAATTDRPSKTPDSDSPTAGDRTHPIMRWSMYDRTPLENLPHEHTQQDFHQAFGSQPLLLDTDAPDGIHQFRFNHEVHSRQPGPPSKPHYGITVRDGKFDPYLTCHAVYIAESEYGRQPRTNHVFIEYVDWHEDQNLFTVTLGS